MIQRYVSKISGPLLGGIHPHRGAPNKVPGIAGVIRARRTLEDLTESYPRKKARTWVAGSIDFSLAAVLPVNTHFFSIGRNDRRE
jgi:hypothetical protein